MERRLLILTLFFLYCSYIENKLYAQLTDSDYQNIIYDYCNTISYGWYKSENAMTNGHAFQIYLGRLNGDFSGEYIEKNIWGTLYGVWSCSIADYGITQDKEPQCHVQVELNDTVVSNYCLHYDGNEKLMCWRNTMYFYSRTEPSASSHIEIRGRTGEIIPISYIKIENANHEVILCKDQYSPHVLQCEIPKEAKFIHVSGDDPNVARGFCSYFPDSGSVIFVILPTVNDYSIFVKKNNLEYYPLNQFCESDSMNAIPLYLKKDDE